LAEKKLENVQMGCTWTSYISSAEGALRYAGLWEGETWKLMGLTGMGFHFIIHKEVCPSSVTVYDWTNDHLGAMDRIGIHSQVYSAMDFRMNTFGKIREDAIQLIQESICQGRPVLVWAPTRLLEFGLITGFDDADGVFYVQDCTGQPCDPMLYSNLGLSEVPMMFYQIFKGKVDVNPEKVFLDSLKYGVSEWEKTFHISPEYASGRMAYEFLIQAMESRNFNDFGLAYNLSVYADSHDCITKYLRYVDQTSQQLKGLDKAAALFEEITGKLKALTALFPFSGSNGFGCTLDRSRVPEGLSLVKECFALEEQAFSVIRSAVGD
jgi:hypothetical protein